MKRGQVINGYTVVGVEDKDFSTKGSGLSIWTFVRKEGVDYFMKEFLSPTYPLLNSPGGPKLKERKKLECDKFEEHHKALIAKVTDTASLGGNLIFTLEFFRYNAKYYKITEKVDVSTASISDIAGLPPDKKILILKTIAHSLDILHKLDIVHGDLKHSNILIKKTEAGVLTSKLIDFDNCYFQGKPPTNRGEVVGDPAYYSPELENYILEKNDSKGADLTIKSDIFALGIIFCQYLTGKLPAGVPVDKYPSNVVNNDGIIKISEEPYLSVRLKGLINKMLLKKPADRPSSSLVFNTLSKILSEDHKHSSDVFLDEKLTISLGALTKEGGTILKPRTPERDLKKIGRMKISMGYKKSPPRP